MRSNTPPHRNTRNATATLLAGVLAFAALAGCIGFGDDAPGDPTRPVAVLEVDREERWAGEAFTFSGTNSSVGEGELVLVSLDLGDGTVFETNDTARAVVHHTYEQGGVYLVNLTIVSQAPDGENRTDEAYEHVAVHERFEGREIALQATPLEESPTSQGSQPFTARDGATLWEVDVHLTGQGVLVPSEVLLRILSPDNETIAEEHVTLDPDAEETVRFSGNVAATGGYALNVTVESGGVSFTSLSRVYYDATGA